MIVLLVGRTRLRTILAALAVVMLFFVSGARAQSTSGGGGAGASAGAAPDAGADAGPAKGGHEIEIWSGGGPSIAGGIPEHRRLERRHALRMDTDGAARPEYFARAL